MKLLRVGELGSEIVAALDNNNVIIMTLLLSKAATISLPNSPTLNNFID